MTCPPRRRGTRLRSCLTTGLSVTMLLLTVLVVPATINGLAAVAAADPLPSNDPFYSYSAPIDGLTPGTVLRTRAITFASGELKTPVPGTQALYRTTDQHGRPTTAVTTMFRPIVPAPTPRIVSYHVAYDALGDQCDPSYTLRGNEPNRLSEVEQAVIAGYLASGHVVSVPDYEGQQQEWTVGRQSGYNALDGIRATESVLKLSARTPVGLVGYSGGSVPTQFAAEVAPDYAPELNIVAAAAGGLPVDMAHNLPYISGSTDWAGVIPALISAYSRAYDLGTDSFLSPYGESLVNTVADLCIADFARNYPGLTDAQMVKAPYTSLLQVPSVVEAINDNIMGASGTPRTPIFLAVGQSDGTGDQVMVTRDVQGLASEYCSRGVSVTYQRYAGDNHGAAYIPFQRDAAVYLQQHFNGIAGASGCATIAPGNSLAPLPVPTA